MMTRVIWVSERMIEKGRKVVNGKKVSGRNPLI